MKRAGFLVRVAAALLDLVCLLPLILVYGFGLGYLEDAGRLTPTTQFLADLSLTLLGVAYSSLEIFFAGTPGKQIMKLRIADARGVPADPWKLALRWSTKNGAGLIAVVAVVAQTPALERLERLYGFIVFIGCLAALGESRQAWHDKWAGTAVYKRRDLVEHRGFEALAPAPAVLLPADPPGDPPVDPPTPAVSSSDP